MADARETQQQPLGDKSRPRLKAQMEYGCKRMLIKYSYVHIQSHMKINMFQIEAVTDIKLITDTILDLSQKTEKQ